mgnify:CR=1 FL=1
MDKDYEMRYYKHLHYINNNNIKTKNIDEKKYRIDGIGLYWEKYP